MKTNCLPTAVLMCHEEDRLDVEGLASWAAYTMNLAGLIVISDTPARKWAVAKRAIRRSGLLNFLDVMAYRLFARIRLNRADEAWKAAEVARLKARYPAKLDAVPRIVVKDPNSPAARDFIAAAKPDVVIARCKFILKPEIFGLARVGAFALHPGICPEYRNAHGCFWALAARDLGRVGMTLLKIDKGIDTGPMYFQGSCPIDEVAESHTVIQYRVVTENLDRVGRILCALCRGTNLEPISTTGRTSAVWGQPGLSTYLRWKHDARSAAVSRRVCA